MSSADAYDDSTPASVLRENLTGVISGTGTYLATLDYSKHKILVCTETGLGFTIDHVYLCEADGLGVVDISSSIPHTHTSSTDGGPLSDVFSSTIDYVDTGGLYMFNMLKADWVEVITSTGSTSESTSETGFTNHKVLKVSTGATSGATANLKKLGMTQSWDKPSYFAITNSFSATTALSSHWGYSVEPLADADNNTRKYGLVNCTATNGNWFIRSADGSARSDSDTGTAFTTNVDSFVVKHNPSAPSVSAYMNGTLLLTKTSNIPTTDSTTFRDPLWLFGIKNSAAADKVATLYKLKMGYYIDDDDWVPA